MRSFEELVGEPEPRLDHLALALAAEFRSVDAAAALARLDALGEELAATAGGEPADEARACAELLGDLHGFVGDREHYDDPRNSMLDLVLERRRGLPILLSIVYVEVARRAGVPLAAVGLPGHFVVGHFGVEPPRLLDPFAGGDAIESAVPPVRPWGAKEIALRMLNNLIPAYERRGHLGRAIRAAELRLLLSEAEPLEAELLSLRARLN